MEEDYDAGHVTYITDMKGMFKQIPTTRIKSLTPEQNVQKIMTDIGGGWYMETIAKGLPPLKRSKQSKKVQDKEGGYLKLYQDNK